MKKIYDNVLDVLERSRGNPRSSKDIKKWTGYSTYELQIPLAVGIGVGKISSYIAGGEMFYSTKKKPKMKLSNYERIIRRMIKGRPRPEWVTDQEWEEWKSTCKVLGEL